MNALVLPQTNGSRTSISSKAEDAWLHSSVRDFFSGLNWEDHPPEVQTMAQLFAEPNAELPNLEMSVGKFFAAVNWDGAEIAAPVAVQPLRKSPEEDFTLDDFSGLF